MSGAGLSPLSKRFSPFEVAGTAQPVLTKLGTPDMIDDTLTRLSRALIAASDKLASEDFLTRQARFVEIEAERQALAESLEADEAAVVAAQEALQAHFAGCATPAAPEPETPADDPSESTVDVEQFFRPVFGQMPDEYGDIRTPHTNGLAAYTED